MQDDALIEMCLLQDEKGFEMLVKKYQNYVINTVYSLTNDTQETDDIAQETFIKVYKNLASFNKKAKFSTWLYRIAINTTLSYLKKKKILSLLKPGEISNGSVKDPLKELQIKDTQELIRNSIAKLPFKFRSILVLKDIEGFSYKEIAKISGCRIGTVESRLFRARNRLKKMLSPIIRKGEKI